MIRNSQKVRRKKLLRRILMIIKKVRPMKKNPIWLRKKRNLKLMKKRLTNMVKA